MTPKPAVARGEALSTAAAAFTEAYRLRDALPSREAAELAHHAGGPSVEEIEQMIIAQRRTNQKKT